MIQIVSLSGGKDSTAMLFKMLERGERIDEVLFCDTTVEFPQMYEHLDAVESRSGLKITRLHAEHDFEYMLCKYHRKRGSRRDVEGYGFCTSHSRWCTAYFKRDLSKRYLRSKYGKTPYTLCVGIAADETNRLRVEAGKRYPLAEMGITEAQALEYCYSLGFKWGGLYEEFGRVSCWCCPLQPYDSLEVLYKKHPDLWAKLKHLQANSPRPFNQRYTLEGFERMFDLNNKAIK